MKLVKGNNVRVKYCYECNEQQEMAEAKNGTNSLFQCLKCGITQTETYPILTKETIVQSTGVQRENAPNEEFQFYLFQP